MYHHRLRQKPFLIDVSRAHAERIVTYGAEGTAQVLVEGNQFRVMPAQQFDLTPATIFGLNERLTANATSPRLNALGRTLRDEFNEEWERYTNALSRAEQGLFDYGWYAYYGERNHLVRYAPPFWHELVSVASSSKLMADPEQKLTWQEIRQVLRQTVVAVAGCSVGSSIAHTTILDLRPAALKVADKSVYKMENINRVRLSYQDIVKSQDARQSLFDLALKNKARTFADQVYAIDPFVDVYTYEEGITEENIAQFFGGDGQEPAASIIIEEIDDPRIKLKLREEARRRRIPLLMMTDIGSCVQFDLLRYDRDANLPLTFGTPDKELYARMEEVYDRPGDRKSFFAFVDALLGTDYRQDELARIIEGKSEIPTSTIIPQLGSTVALSGALASEAIARIRLGYDYPPRFIFNKRTLEIRRYDWP